MQFMRIPGLIDPHVHLRDPEETQKEDFTTGTRAALAGGYTTLIDMPNNKTPVTTRERLEKKRTLAKEKIVCDVGFHFGSLGDNIDEFAKLQLSNILRANVESREVKDENSSRLRSNNNYLVMGLKLYLNKTTGNYLLGKSHLPKIFASWPSEIPILVHAIDETFDDVLEVVKQTPRKIHLCHVSTKYELSRVIEAKERGLPISCGVTPHHLFLSEEDTKHLGPFGAMKPPLRPRTDVDFLWKNIQAIDLIESDHAPHTIEEKQGVTRAEGLPATRRSLKLASPRSSIDGKEPATGPREVFNVPFGVPGLETTLPLLFTAVSENKLTIGDVIRLCHEGPAKVFNIKTANDTYTEVDTKANYEIKNKNLFTKSKWSPFNGWRVHGKIQRVFLRGKKVFEDGKVLASPGSGKLVTYSS
ncbi:MAG: amidohydrolase family protein [Candidatus Levybacteria bacterium]|nr:amidohydrolase family protein [Candidatus Levybacteria bacterium]